VETLEYWKAKAEALEAALRRVEAWSFDEAVDLTPAGYEDWCPLLHGQRIRPERYRGH
jgi:hypothetical protein